MVKRLNEAFDNALHSELHKKKDEVRNDFNLSKLSWHDYILHISGVKKLDSN